MIDVENGDKPSGLGGAADLLIKPSRNGPAVCQSGQLVPVRHRFDAFQRRLQRVVLFRQVVAVNGGRNTLTSALKARSPLRPAGVEVGIVSLDPRIKMTATAPTAPKHQQMTKLRGSRHKAERAYGEEGGEWLEPDLGNQERHAQRDRDGE